MRYSVSGLSRTRGQREGRVQLTCLRHQMASGQPDEQRGDSHGCGVSSKSAKSKPGETTHATRVDDRWPARPTAIRRRGPDIARRRRARAEPRDRSVGPPADGQAHRPAALPEPQLVRDHPVPGRPFTRQQKKRHAGRERPLTSAGRHQLGMAEALAVPPTLRVALHAQGVRVGDQSFRRHSHGGDGNRPPRWSTRGRVAPTLKNNSS